MILTKSCYMGVSAIDMTQTEWSYYQLLSMDILYG